ncbi:origin recognition complex subunit 6 [Glossina fuscipes]|uniref:Origin recognition complex subunit 6 n=1 Tax=Glossina fuscipes TaxID=7396 RepID=A0A9C6DZP4_9MUSC|nr:origin recognition complex subunit 6 [Glossina fuscipes]
MSTLMEQLFNKIGLRDVPNIIEKTSELMRLLELKSANIPLQINEYAKIVISGDIAAKVLGVACDQVSPQKKKSTQLIKLLPR